MAHLDPTDLPRLNSLLGALLPRPAISAESAGDGNMNLTLRVGLEGGGTLIVKQARPWVEKYPQIAAPDERALVEASFYRAVSADAHVAAAMPTLLGIDADQRIQVFEDLGPSTDFADVYGSASMSLATLDTLLGWLDRLHGLDVPPSEVLANRDMRALNHEHIFDLPFQPDNGIDLDGICPGLHALRNEVLAQPGLHEALAKAGAIYLADGKTLLHGDFYPGSFLRHPDGAKVIDPEFAFLGDPAFDRGVLAGHMVLAQLSPAHAERCLEGAPSGSRRFGGIEILRRLLGVAQLPLEADLSARTAMVRTALLWIDP